MKMFNNFKILLVLAISLVFGQIYLPKGAWAADFHSPRTDALGGSGHASPFLTDSIYLNPSFTSFSQTHALSVDYLIYRGNGPIDTPAGLSDYYGHNLNVSILDGSPDSLFQAGVGYTRRDDSSMIHIGASKGFLEKFGAGIGSKFIFPNGSNTSKLIEGTLSMTGVLTDWFQTAIIVDNLVESAADRGFYREFTLGTKFNVDSIILIYFDPNWTPTFPTGNSHLGYQLGMEFPFFKELFLRIGKFTNSNIPYQNKRGDGYGIGLGWLGPRINFDYAFGRVLAPLIANSHNFQVTIYF